ncbi:hypothetical protein CLHUN_23420 [Ruminiclostridium hungatei]|uniref:D-alanyl-D-alanine carboxypeptidase n=1 Tax=Ruminiclostridium hungatei TaxID=48256 RepID=A0A1V4SJ23_RUMHU|nr:peptidase M15 [Ruminiclostridium hungatei]OPX43860.1 hypothetical protein CLHUN_23420 [Ruminiclostridium hungatei]
MCHVKFKYPEQACVHPKLLSAINQVCRAYGKDALCTGGYRSLECQKTTARIVLEKNKGSYQLNDGSVYIGTGSSRKCLSAAYGKSNHCFGLAMDMDGWFEALENKELSGYGLIKPLDYEPWHVQLIELTGLSEDRKAAIRDSILKGEAFDMTIREFQALTALNVDGIPGPKTQKKAREVLLVCQKILGNDFKSPQEVIAATQKNPELWLAKLKEVKYFDSFILNIVKKMSGRE